MTQLLIGFGIGTFVGSVGGVFFLCLLQGGHGATDSAPETETDHERKVRLLEAAGLGHFSSLLTEEVPHPAESKGKSETPLVPCPGRLPFHVISRDGTSVISPDGTRTPLPPDEAAAVQAFHEVEMGHGRGIEWLGAPPPVDKPWLGAPSPVDKPWLGAPPPVDKPWLGRTQEMKARRREHIQIMREEKDPHGNHTKPPKRESEDDMFRNAIFRSRAT